MNDAMRDWVASVDYTHYLIGSVAGHPFPMLVREFQQVISEEARQQVWIGTAGCRTSWRLASAAGPTRLASSPISYPIAMSHSTDSRPAAKASRPAATPRRFPPVRWRTARHADVRTSGRRRTNKGVPLDLRGARLSRRRPGARLLGLHRAGALGHHRHRSHGGIRTPVANRSILPAIESAHALAGALKLAERLPARADGRQLLVLVNLSGREDKDVDTAIKWFDLDTRGRGSESGRPTGDSSSDGGGLAMGGPSRGAGEQV